MSRPSETLRATLRLMVITDREAAGGRDPLEIAVAAAGAGATAVQLRDKGATGRELLEMAGRLREALDPHGTLLLVNDRFDIAAAAAADGVHLGPDDLPVAAVRRVVPRGFVIGASADTLADAERAVAAGADYIGAGAVFPTSSKPEAAREAIGTDRLSELARALPVPIVAIGGITPENAAEVGASGAAGIAVISAVMAAPDPVRTTRELLRAFESGRSGTAGR